MSLSTDTVTHSFRFDADLDLSYPGSQGPVKFKHFKIESGIVVDVLTSKLMDSASKQVEHVLK